MKTIVVIMESSNACVYGIGTYLSQLKLAMSPIPDIKIVEVQIENTTQGSIQYEENVLKIPKGIHYSSDKYNEFLYGVARVLTRYFTDGVIFQFNMHSHLPLMRMIAKYFPSSPIIYVVHYQNWAFRTKGILNSLKDAIMRVHEEDRALEEQLLCDTFFGDQDVFNEATHIVALSEYTANILAQVFKVSVQKISIIRNGLMSLNIAPNRRKNLVTEPVLIYVGRIHEEKGVIELIRAYKKVRIAYPKSKLFIVGDGDFPSAIKETKEVWGDVIFTGRLEKEEVYSLYKDASIGILPSYTEQCSYTAIEMMMFGLPIVAIQTTGLSEMIVHGETGILIPLNEKEGKGHISEQLLGEGIIEAIQKQEILDKGILHFQQNYNLKKMAKLYNQLYDRV